MLQISKREHTQYPGVYTFILNNGEIEFPFTLVSGDKSVVADWLREHMDEWPEPTGWVPPPVTVEMIKDKAAKLIEATGHDRYALRKVSTGEDIPQAVLNEAARLRTRSTQLELELSKDPNGLARDWHTDLTGLWNG